MIAFIHGTVFALSQDSIVIDNHGIGWQINFMQQGSVNLGQEVTIYTYQSFGQDDQQLFGFLQKSTLELFQRLIMVKGLGPKTALKMLAGGNQDEVIKAIETGDVGYLKSMPGIGSKTASQIILDLKGKLVSGDQDQPVNQNMQEALAALKNLGYKTYEINDIQKELAATPAASADEYLKTALKLLLKRKGM